MQGFRDFRRRVREQIAAARRNPLAVSTRELIDAWTNWQTAEEFTGRYLAEQQRVEEALGLCKPRTIQLATAEGGAA